MLAKRKPLQMNFRVMGIYQKCIETYIEKQFDLKTLDEILYNMAIPSVKVNSVWKEGSQFIDLLKKTSLTVKKKGIDFFRDAGLPFIPLFRKYFIQDWTKANVKSPKKFIETFGHIISSTNNHDKLKIEVQSFDEAQNTVVMKFGGDPFPLGFLIGAFIGGLKLFSGEVSYKMQRRAIGFYLVQFKF